MTVVGDVLSVARTFFGLKEQFIKSQRDQRDRIADYLDTLSTTVSEAATELRLGTIPHGKCAEMGTHAELLSEVIGDTIDANRLNDLSTALKAATDVERIYYELEGTANSDSEIAKLDEAVGLMRALVAFIRAT